MAKALGMRKGVFIFCENCQHRKGVEYEIDGKPVHPVCPGCDQQICLYCGCTDYEACAEGCYWIDAGRCSSCLGKTEFRTRQ